MKSFAILEFTADDKADVETWWQDIFEKKAIESAKS